MGPPPTKKANCCNFGLLGKFAGIFRLKHSSQILPANGKKGENGENFRNFIVILTTFRASAEGASEKFTKFYILTADDVFIIAPDGQCESQYPDSEAPL